ncbi:LacI family DNA-binding transcriptional regulator [Micromonospora sp. BQ11]|uniref:LacI family DNA-binding transcriptional regulator n=1 Tax=Micromonospora sp. BQ11 TaxID=3452212 RepID=UPI003F889681
MVSNVVSGYAHVRAETRERVQRAIDELKYRPNVSARSLRRGRTGLIALAVPEIAAPYFAELANLVQVQAAEHGVTLLIDQTGADRSRELLVLDGYRTHVIDGLILSPMAITAEDLAAQRLDIPTVLLGDRPHGGGSTAGQVAGETVTPEEIVCGYELVVRVSTTSSSGRRRT